MSDYQWCNGIYPGTFYNWVSKLKKSGYTFLDSTQKASAKANLQEVVKADLIEPAISNLEQNVTFQETSSEGKLAAELQIGNITLAENIYIACGYIDMRKSICGELHEKS